MLSHRSTILKSFEVAHVEYENIKVHIPETERSIVVGVPFGEIVDWKLLLLIFTRHNATKDKEQESEKFHELNFISEIMKKKS